MNERGAPQRKGGLGRGLAALIPTGPPVVDLAPRSTGVIESPRPRPSSESPGASDLPALAEYREIDLAAIVPNPQQPRTQFDDEALAELEHSIREFGLLQPIVVREVSPDRYQLVMGERRWRAATQGRAPAGARDRAADRGRRDAARRAPGEHPPRPAQPPRRGSGLRTAPRRVRGDPQRARRPARPQPSRRHQHHPPAPAAGLRAAARGGGRAVRGARAGPPRPGRRGQAGGPRRPHRRRRHVGAGDGGGGAC